MIDLNDIQERHKLIGSIELTIINALGWRREDDRVRRAAEEIVEKLKTLLGKSNEKDNNSL